MSTRLKRAVRGSEPVHGVAGARRRRASIVAALVSWTDMGATNIPHVYAQLKDKLWNEGSHCMVAVG